MDRKRFALFVVVASLLFVSGCANRCCRFPIMRNVAARFRARFGWCPCSCGQAIEAASVPLCADDCYEGPVVMQPAGPPPGFEGPLLMAPPFPSVSENGSRIMPQPQRQPPGPTQAQPEPYKPES